MSDLTYVARLQYSADDKASKVSSRVAHNVTRNNSKVKRSFSTLRTSAARMARQVNSAFGQISAASLAGTAAIVAFGAKTLGDTAISIDKFKNQMYVATGSIAGANNEFEKAKDLARSTGASLNSITESYGKFSVAAKSAGLQGKELNNVYSAFLEGSVAMGLSTEATNLALKAVEQMMAKGTVMAEELKQQLGDHLPDALGIGARAIGVTTGELMKMMKNGELLASEFVPKLANQIKKEWGGASQRATAKLQASINNLKTSVIEAKEAIIDNGGYQILQGVVDELTGAIMRFGDFIRNDFSPALKGFSAIIKSLGGDFTYLDSEIDAFFLSFKIKIEEFKTWVDNNIGTYGLIAFIILGSKFRIVVAALNKIKDKLKGLIGIVSKLFNKVSGFFRGISDFIKEAWDNADGLQKTLIAMAGFSTAHYSDATGLLDLGSEYELNALKEKKLIAEELAKVEAEMQSSLNFVNTKEGKNQIKQLYAYRDMLRNQTSDFEIPIEPESKDNPKQKKNDTTPFEHYIDQMQKHRLKDISNIDAYGAAKLLKEKGWNKLTLDEQKSFMDAMVKLKNDAKKGDSSGMMDSAVEEFKKTKELNDYVKDLVQKSRTEEIKNFTDLQVQKFLIEKKWNERTEAEKKAFFDRMLSYKKSNVEEQNALSNWVASPEGQGTSTLLSTTAQMFGQLASMQDTSSKKGFEQQKDLMSAQAAISTGLAVMNTLANPALLYPTNIAAAWMIGAIGAMQIAKIQSQQYQPRMMGGNVQANSPYVVGEKGREMFVPNTNGRIYPNDVFNNRQNHVKTIVTDEKPVNVNISVTAADTKDFDRLIVERMPLIVNGIRRGLA